MGNSTEHNFLIALLKYPLLNLMKEQGHCWEALINLKNKKYPWVRPPLSSQSLRDQGVSLVPSNRERRYMPLSSASYDIKMTIKMIIKWNWESIISYTLGLCNARDIPQRPKQHKFPDFAQYFELNFAVRSQQVPHFVLLHEKSCLAKSCRDIQLWTSAFSLLSSTVAFFITLRVSGLQERRLVRWS